MKKTNKTFGIILRNLRDSVSLTQQELGDRLGLSRNQIKGYELEINEPDIRALKKISEFFNVSIDYLLGSNISGDYCDLQNLQTKIQSNYLALKKEDRKRFARQSGVYSDFLKEHITALYDESE